MLPWVVNKIVYQVDQHWDAATGPTEPWSWLSSHAVGSAPIGVRVLSLTWGVHKTSVLQVLSSLQSLSRRPWTLRNILHSNEHLGDHQELEQGWGDAIEGSGRTGRAVKESRYCSWSEPCRAGLLGMERGTKHECMVGEQLSSTCNSKATQEAVAVWMSKGEIA